MNRTTLGLAIGAGYLLGRTKKLKMALAVGSVVAGKKLNLSPKMIADVVSQQLKNNPQFKEIGDQLREDLRGVGKAASGAMVERQMSALADRLHGRTADVRDQLSGVASQGGSDDQDEDEDEPRDEDESRDEADDEDAREEPDDRDDGGDDGGRNRRREDSGRASRGEGAPRKKAAKKAPAKKAPAKKAAEGAPAKKAAAKKTTAARKTAAKKTAASGGAARGAASRRPKGGDDR
ncbi:DNA primase [Streptomyces sp. NPDC051452]|uniref:DNA primase n=1 Tax=Streptomyces sp. NPDC051452 TaxID=3365654 RepID=UPI00379CE9BF